MITKPIVLPIEGDLNSEENAAKIGKSIIKAIDSEIERRKNGKNPDNLLHCDTDEMDDDQLKAIIETEEYKLFQAEVEIKIGELAELFGNNTKRFNCAFVMGVTTIAGKNLHNASTVWSGRRDAIGYSIRNIQDQEQLNQIKESYLIKSLLDDILKTKEESQLQNTDKD